MKIVSVYIRFVKTRTSLPIIPQQNICDNCRINTGFHSNDFLLLQKANAALLRGIVGTVALWPPLVVVVLVFRRKVRSLLGFQVFDYSG